MCVIIAIIICNSNNNNKIIHIKEHCDKCATKKHFYLY